MFLNNSDSKDYSKNNIIIGVLIAILLYILFTHIEFNKKEGFKVKNKQYVKLSDTQISNKNKEWKNLTLKQCQVKCNEDDKCIGFSRDNIDDELKGNCYSSDKINSCHSLRKGNPEQRNKAINYNTYIKKHYTELENNLFNKCLGDEKLTLNRNIFINSYLKPDSYLCIDNNLVVFKKSKIKDGLFFKQCGFKIVKGLEGSGTVSFIMSDNNNETYYLSNNNNYLVLLPINNSKSNSKERSNASFELLDGLSDKYKFTIRTYSIVKTHLYLIMEGEGKKTNPRIKLVSRDNIDSNIKKESATFNIVNQIDNNSILEDFRGQNQRKYPKKIRTQYFDKFQDTEVYDTPIDSIIIVDKEQNQLLIPAFMKEIDNDKLNYLVTKYNRKIMFDDYDRELLVNEYIILKKDTKIYQIKDIDSSNKKIILNNNNSVELKDIKNINLELKDNKIHKIKDIDYTNIKIILNNGNTIDLKDVKKTSLKLKEDNKIYQITDIDYSNNKIILHNKNTVDLKKVKRINLELNNLVRIKGNKLKTVYKIIKIDYVEKSKLLFTLDNNEIKEYNDLEKVGFNLNEINKVIITNPNINSVRLYDYDFSLPSSSGNFKNIFDKINIINDLTRNIKKMQEYDTLEEVKILVDDLNIPTINKSKEELYKDYIIIRAFNEQLELDSKKELFTKELNNNIYSKIINTKINNRDIEELRNKMNRNTYFNIKSLKIFYNNPKKEFITKKTDNVVDTKIKAIESLYKDKNNDLSKEEYYFNKKKEELNAYNQEIVNSNLKLKNMSNSLRQKLSNIHNNSLDYKINRFSENYYMSKNNYK